MGWWEALLQVLPEFLTGIVSGVIVAIVTWWKIRQELREDRIRKGREVLFAGVYDSFFSPLLEITRDIENILKSKKPIEQPQIKTLKIYLSELEEPERRDLNFKGKYFAASRPIEETRDTLTEKLYSLIKNSKDKRKLHETIGWCDKFYECLTMAFGLKDLNNAMRQIMKRSDC